MTDAQLLLSQLLRRAHHWQGLCGLMLSENDLDDLPADTIAEDLRYQVQRLKQTICEDFDRISQESIDSKVLDGIGEPIRRTGRTP